ncbi:MAG: helix-turn-helix transcriptional regulator [Lagierella massiliensis]|nr:helix-turn-helix transcriptional regulator [Lagierella massiliensis]
MKNRIEEYRKPLGLSQHRLGKKVGVSRVSINKIENGKTIPNLKLAISISDVLGKCLYEVFDLDGTETYQCPCVLEQDKEPDKESGYEHEQDIE